MHCAAVLAAVLQSVLQSMRRAAACAAIHALHCAPCSHAVLQPPCTVLQLHMAGMCGAGTYGAVLWVGTYGAVLWGGHLWGHVGHCAHGWDVWGGHLWGCAVGWAFMGLCGVGVVTELCGVGVSGAVHPMAGVCGAALMEQQYLWGGSTYGVAALMGQQ